MASLFVFRAHVAEYQPFIGHDDNKKCVSSLWSACLEQKKENSDIFNFEKEDLMLKKA